MQRLKPALALVVAIVATTAVTTATAAAELGFLPTTTFTGEGGASKIVALGGDELMCNANTLKEGAMTNDGTGKIGKIDFTGCKSLTVAANSLGDVAETVLIDNATYKICILDKAKLEMGIVIRIPSPGVHVEVPLAKTLYLISGVFMGQITPDVKKTKEFVVEFKKGANDQEFKECELGAKEVLLLEVNENKKPEEAALVQKETLTMVAATEIMES